MLQSLGSLYERRKRAQEALATYEKALTEQASPQYQATVLYKMVRIKREAGDVDGTVKTWEKAIGIQPDVEYGCRWRLALAQYCAEQELGPKARSLCEDILRISKTEATRTEASRLLEKLPSP